MENKSSHQSKSNEFDTTLQRKAVLMADTYTNLLSPIKDEISEILVPLCNIPLIEYILDFLFSNSISEIIICSSFNYESLRNYLKKHYNKNNNIKILVSDEFQNMGDCLRKINSEKLITSDFVLVRGLTIANFNLEKAFDYHLAKKKEDPYVILTSVMKNYKNDKFIKTKYDENFLVVNKLNNQIMQYESLRDTKTITLNENIKLNLSKPKTANDIPQANKFQIRTNLFDTFVDICSLDVLNHFSENFDYHSIRDDLFKNIIVNEIFNDTFVLYELSENDYVGIIKNPETYFKVTQEIINRWAHPVVLENLHISPKLKTLFKIRYYNLYFDGNVNINSKAKVEYSCVLGSDSKIDEFSEINSSVIGKEVKIGKNVKIINSIIMNNVNINDDVTIENSIIGKNVDIEKKLTLKNCYVANGLNLSFPDEEGKVLESLRIKLDVAEDYESDSDLYGDGNNNKENNSQSNTENSKVLNKLEMIENEDFLMNLDDKHYMFTCVEENLTDNTLDEEDESDEFTQSEQEDQEEEENFEEEMRGIIQPGIDDPDKTSDIVQEVMALKFSFKYKTFSDSKFFFQINKIFNFLASKSSLDPIFADFTERYLSNCEKIGRANIQNLMNTLQSWAPLFQRLVPSEKEKLELIAVIENLCLLHVKLSEAFHVIIQYLNSELKIFDKDILVKWSKLDQSNYNLMEEGCINVDTVHHKKFVEKLVKYINQLS